MQVTLAHYLVVGAVLFSLGILAVITRKNAVLMLMGVELILNSANINFLAFSRYQGMNLQGHAAAVFVILLAAAEAAIALAIVLHVYKMHNTINADELRKLRE